MFLKTAAAVADAPVADAVLLTAAPREDAGKAEQGNRRGAFRAVAGEQRK
jgi:hypothetical protein